ncbi:UPF0764 protein C16orf89 homolog [Haliotis asinina]|uniref:UPF0764 protein C16orf89 homolog n=1 Tax=Haliotis asinina TaxID=109174 RepID=UPI0035321B5C
MVAFAKAVCCLLLFGVPASTQAKAVVNNDTDVLLDRTLSALGATLAFFSKEYRSVNLDAIIGTRIVEGTLNVLLRRLDRNSLLSSVPVGQVQQIKQLRDLARKVSGDATPYVAGATPNYYRRIGDILADGFWELDYPSRDIDATIPIWEYKLEETMHEQDSDDCLTEFFGTGKTSNKECHISDKCWRMMTADGYSGYSLSHEIFYLEIGERFGCLPQMLWKVLTHHQASLESQREKFCANMLSEARLLAANDYPPPKQDLFMEQGALCGMLGYRQFVNSDWLEKILGWQDVNVGCFRGSPTDGLGADDVHFKRNPLRVKREEKRLSDGCLCHRTTVAAAALAQYVRFILEAKLEAEGNPIAS